VQVYEEQTKKMHENKKISTGLPSVCHDGLSFAMHGATGNCKRQDKKLLQTRPPQL
jgi:hypothetical protein